MSGAEGRFSGQFRPRRDQQPGRRLVGTKSVSLSFPTTPGSRGGRNHPGKADLLVAPFLGTTMRSVLRLAAQGVVHPIPADVKSGVAPALNVPVRVHEPVLVSVLAATVTSLGTSNTAGLLTGAVALTVVI
jgi:hypothetical protein